MIWLSLSLATHQHLKRLEDALLQCIQTLGLSDFTDMRSLVRITSRVARILYLNDCTENWESQKPSESRIQWITRINNRHHLTNSA